jgi:hypothetical protein
MRVGARARVVVVFFVLVVLFVFWVFFAFIIMGLWS